MTTTTEITTASTIRSESRAVSPMPTRPPAFSLPEYVQHLTQLGKTNKRAAAAVYALAEAIASRTPTTVAVPLDAVFLDMANRSQAKNRLPNWPHCGQLGGKFQQGWRPWLTDFAFDVAGYGINGGHSSRGLAQANIPAPYWEKLEWYITTENAKNADGSTVFNDAGQPVTIEVAKKPPLKYAPKDSVPDEDGADELAAMLDHPAKEIPCEESEEQLSKMTRAELLAAVDRYLARIPEELRWVSVKVNVPEGELRAYDCSTRPRTADEQLAQYPPAVAYCRDSSVFNGNFRLLAATLRMLRICIHKERTTDEQGRYVYGTPSGGGNINPMSFPALFDCFLPILVRNLEHFETQKLEGGNYICKAKLADDWTPNPKRRETLEDYTLSMIVAACRLDPKGADRLCDLLANGGDSPALTFAMKQHKEAKVGTLKAVRIQSYLIAAGNDMPAPIQKDASKDPAPEHSVAGRGTQWDQGLAGDDSIEVNAWGEHYLPTLRQSTRDVRDYFASHVDVDLAEVAPPEVEASRSTPKKPRGKKGKATAA
jgi:hypothetical protein